MNSQFQLCIVILMLLVHYGQSKSVAISISKYHRPGAEFYEDVNFKGLIWQGPTIQYSLQQACTPLPEWGQAKISSLRTTSCIIAFVNDSCETDENHPSFSFAPGNYSNLMEIKHHSQNADKTIRSFRQCTLEECNHGNGVHVVLYKNMEKEDKLVEYFNLDKCTNLPSYSAKNVEALDNHGNCVTLHDSMNCTGKSVTIQGGVSQESLNLKHVNFAGNAVSIGPCANVTACSAYVAYY